MLKHELIVKDLLKVSTQ